ncbi:hypothetical protein LCGC14_2666720, partial [marine sediment metagenome]
MEENKVDNKIASIQTHLRICEMFASIQGEGVTA